MVQNFGIRFVVKILDDESEFILISKTCPQNRSYVDLISEILRIFINYEHEFNVL